MLCVFAEEESDDSIDIEAFVGKGKGKMKARDVDAKGKGKGKKMDYSASYFGIHSYIILRIDDL